MKAGGRPATMRLFYGAGMSDNDTPRTQWLQLFAGTDAGGKPVLEKLEAAVQDNGLYELLRSPLFVRDLAAGDLFDLNPKNPADYRSVRRSGNLAIRVFRREGIEELEQYLTPEVEKLDGSCDLQTDRALVYSLHVNIGFGPIEQLFDGAMAKYPDCVWYYGNIYDRADGVTPLHWWDAFINQV